MSRAKANALRTELVKKWKVDEETNVETWTLSNKQHDMNAWRDYIGHGMDVSNKLDAAFDFPKIQLMPLWVEQICWYGALQQYSAERHESAHWMNLQGC